MKKVYLVHGWEGNPHNAWFPWLIQSLEKSGFETRALEMPTPDYPEPGTWVNQMTKDIPNPDGDTILVGHSIGCQTIMRYLDTLPKGTKISGIVLVAPFFELSRMEDRTQDELDVWSKWTAHPFDRTSFAQKTKKITCVFSDNDEDVVYETNAELFKKLGATIILEHNKGHFSDDAGVTELPSALNAILEIAQA